MATALLILEPASWTAFDRSAEVLTNNLTLDDPAASAVVDQTTIDATAVEATAIVAQMAATPRHVNFVEAFRR